MSAPRSPNPVSTGGSTPPNTIDPSPLLSPASPGNGAGGGGDDSLNGFRSSGRLPSIRDAAQFFRRAGGRRLMREPSMAVRETAAAQLEERQTDWAYSRPIVILDILWNLAFITIAGGVLVTSRDEKPVMPLRPWILGYAAQCGAHMICVCIEYRRRRLLMMQRRRLSEPQLGREDRGVRSGPRPSTPLPMPPLRDLEEGSGSYTDGDQNQEEEGSSVTKHLESANTMFSFIWWMIGFYWVSAGGPALTRDSPQLYWLCIVFLAFDVFFVVFCVALACVVGIAVCCCLPCIIAILYAVADQEGASDEDIRQLPKYKFRRTGGYEELGGEISKPSGGIMTQCGSDPPHEHVLSAEDVECCICLSTYDDGAELRELPCGHHFHCACIDKWLHINATCPLCKYNVIKSNNHGTEGV